MTNLGQKLRQARMDKGVSLAQAERATRISRAHLDALESHRFDELPAAAYARGIVRTYANYLGLDATDTLDAFEAETKAFGGPPIAPATPTLRRGNTWAPNFALMAFALVIALVLFSWIYSAYFRDNNSPTDVTSGVPTVTAVSESILAAMATESPMSVAVMPTSTPAPTATTAPPIIVNVPTPTPAPAQSSSSNNSSTTADEPADEPAAEPDVPDVPDTTGAHTFVIWVTQEVWVGATVNGESAVDAVLPAGTELTFQGDSFTATSGNSEFVFIYVDGESYSMGDTWDATFSFP